MSNALDKISVASSWEMLRRRKVVQWGLAYAAAAWGLLQGIAYLCDTFGWSHYVQQLATLTLIAGLPIAITLAWYHGDLGRQRVNRTEVVILSLLVAAGAAAIGWYEPPASGALEHEVADETLPASAPPPPAEARPSVAVLPFENRSAEPGDAFFVDGIQDDILTQLSKVSALKVISRTSVERFRDSRLPLGEIARELGVGAILEGGVQRAGDRIRINVQLIDAASDQHLWAEKYDRNLTAVDIFAIQTEVASAIAAALKATLTAQEQALVQEPPTRSLPAWEAYQNGRFRLMRRTSEAIGEARSYFEAAVAEDPQFALAYAGLADAAWLEADYKGLPMEPAVMQAEQYLGTALRLNPNLAEARTTLAKLAQGRREFDKAEALYREAIQLNPNYSQAYHWYAQLLSNQGRDEEASASMKRAVELDPLSPSLRTSLGSGLSATGDFDAALRELEKAVDIDPLSAPPYDALGSIHARGYGRLDRAIPYLEKASRLDPGRAYLTDHLAQAYLDIGALDQAEAVLRRPSGSVEAGSLAVAYARLYRGDRSGAYELAAKAFAQQPRNREALRLLRDADLASGDARRARERYAQAYPELLENGPPAVESGNLGVATDLALVLLRTDERARALELLDRHDGFVSRTRMIRMGPWGYGIADVQVLMMRGERAAASSALRAAGAAGWRGPYWRYYRDWDPALAAIRQDPDFKAAFAAIERDMTGQRAALAKTRLE